MCSFLACFARRRPANAPKLNRADGRIGNFRGRIGGGPTPVSPHSSFFLVDKTGSVK
jgi:hypothetical protein